MAVSPENPKLVESGGGFCPHAGDPFQLRDYIIP